MYIIRILAILFASVVLLNASNKTNNTKLQEMANKFEERETIEKSEAIVFANKKGFPVRKVFKDGTIMEIQKITNGIPIYYTTNNENAATSTSTQNLWQLGITGKNYTHLGEWDGGAVRITHDELAGRVTQVDGATSYSDHATHVAGTLIASGQDASAKGMAHEANLSAYDWNLDESEMATAASNGMEVSNHSYGIGAGWGGNNSWYGDTSVSQNETYLFGFYSSLSQDWDEIAYNAPHYLIVKSAGNDRNDDAPASGAEHTHNGGSAIYTDNHYSDGFDDGGYDTIPTKGVAKNILTVGAVKDVSGYISPDSVVMSSFSGWGPADDGRIKPDIVGNGISLYSSVSTGDSHYDYMSGTSMSSPNVAGTLALLQQYYKSTHSGVAMRSATLKALAIHTADEAGEHNGPDYKYGWGLLNANSASIKIREDETINVIDEIILSNNGSYVRDIALPEGISSFKVTIVWTDPAGTPTADRLDPEDKMLVNNLNLKVTHNGVTYYPWKLDKMNPGNAATKIGKNDVDNVEQVYIESPDSGVYKVTVDHDGALASNQNFSIIFSQSEEEILQTILSEDFEGGSLPAEWTVVNNIASPVTWDINTDSNIDLGNYTNGSGDCAAANSDTHKDAPYSTELRTPVMNLSTYSTASLSFFVNYQDVDGNDYFDVDVSTDGGTNWTTVMHWNEDHGTHADTPGEEVLLDLTNLAAGKSSVMVRFHYYDLDSNAWDWYVEVDNVLISGKNDQKSFSLPPAIITYLLN